jgi:1-phosphatidylinositol phosphodiesterase
MSTISSSKTIDSLSIPGTHDSGCDIMTPWVQTQDLSIPRQLNMGIRYLDIRCRHINNIFAIHHGEAYLNKNFNDVLLDITQFLAQNPSETVLMRVKQEYKSIGNNRSFENTFKMYRDRYASFFWTYNSNNNPTLFFRLEEKSLFCKILPDHCMV